MSKIILFKQQVGAWLMRHSLTIFFGVMALLAFSILIGGKKSQEVKEVAEQVKTENVLTQRQVKAKDKVIAARNDSIRIITIYKDRWREKSDSNAVVARKADAKADSLLRARPLLPDETPTSEYLTANLEAYKPRSWALPSGDSIR